jgi:hypothetical protein
MEQLDKKRYLHDQLQQLQLPNWILTPCNHHLLYKMGVSTVA